VRHKEVDAVLRVANLTKTYTEERRGERPVGAVQEVSFEIVAGDFFSLLGPSGCGKTTLLRSIAGLERPESGEIWIDGELVFGPRVWVKPERRPIGMVFQSYAVWPHMKVFDNVAFPLVSGRQRMKSAETRPIVMDLLERVGLASYASAWATRLSGGQQQRLALARALACRPKLLLLDEPLSNLDAALRTTLRQDLKETQRTLGVTTLYVTHDQMEALALSDKVAVMEHGKIQQIGPPREIYAFPETAFVARVVGTANIFEGRVKEAGTSASVETDFGLVHCTGGQGHQPGDLVRCFIRPDKVRVAAAGVPAPDSDQFPGQVIAADFVGDRQDCTVAVGTTRLRGWALADPPLAPGDPVIAAFDRSGAAILRDDPAPPAPAGAELPGSRTDSVQVTP
jgi:iron(III) transport system ATP-binding protein